MPKRPGRRFGYQITDEDKVEFIDLIYAGMKGNDAAKEIGSTGTVMRRLKRPGAEHYDEAFADAWLEAEQSEEHRFNREETLRAEIDERSHTSDAILVKRAMAELPEWEALRHQNFRHDIRIAAQILPGMTLEELEAYRARLVEKPELKMLPPAEADVA